MSTALLEDDMLLGTGLNADVIRGVEWRMNYQHATDRAPKAVYPPSFVSDDDLPNKDSIPAPVWGWM